MKTKLGFNKRELIRHAGSSIFVAVSITAVIMAFSLVALKFMWTQVSYNNRVHDKKELARDILIQNIATVNELKSSYEQLQDSGILMASQGTKDNATVILDALPQRYDFPALKTSIEELVRISGVALSSYSGDDQQSLAVDKMVIPVPTEIPFNFAIDGTYVGAMAFIANLEHTIRQTEITRLNISGGDANMTASFSAVTYYQPRVDVGVTMETIQ